MAELQKARRLVAMGTMAAGIAHQINNPIGSIQMSSELALATPDDDIERDAVVRDALENAVAQSQRCGRIVSSLLQFARNEPTPKQSENLAGLVRRAAAATEPYAAGLGVDIDVAEVETPLPVHASAIELDQALLNVLRNACEATEDRGRVRISVVRSGRQATVTIEDDGRGMSDAEIDRALDPFFTTRLGHGGTGLGLSVTHSIVSDHGGLLSIESERGTGTSIRIAIPLLEDEAADTSA